MSLLALAYAAAACGVVYLPLLAVSFVVCR